MKISININRTLKESIKDKRTSVYVWKDLNQLKEFYSEVVDSKTINAIADKIRSGHKKFNNRKFKVRAGDGDILNESGLCNLVEMELLDNQAVLDKFLQKPVEFKS